MAACLLAGSLGAQTYLGNLDGSSSSSTFTTATDGFQSLAVFGWASVSGVGGQVFGQTGGTTNDVLLGGTDFGNYEVEYNTSVGLLANSVYTLSLRMGFVSGGTAGSANYDISLGTKNGATFTALTADNPSLEASSVNRASGPTFGASIGANVANSILVAVTYTTGASVGSDPIYVRWAQTSSSGTALADFFSIDNVTLSVAAIPEPSTYAALLSLGALGLAARRRLPRWIRAAVPGRILRLLSLAGCLGLVPGAAWGQTVLLNEDFENPTIAGIPTGWNSFLGTYDDTTANPSATGINTSANVLIADSLSARVATPTINLTGLTGATFILEFDLYNPTQTTSHGLIIGYGQSGVVDVWAASSNGGTGPLGGGQTLFNLSAPATWQHFSIDVTSWVNAYDGGPGDLSLFTLSFQDWSTPTVVMSSLDNVTLTAVPEPSTYAAIFGAFALTLVAWRRRAGSHSQFRDKP